MRKFREQKKMREVFTERYGHARPPVGAWMGDKLMIAVGGSLYIQERDGYYNFVNAIHDNALTFFGVSMLEQEEAKPLHERHPALQWMDLFVQHSQALDTTDNNADRSARIGASAAWLRFAYDLFTIHDNAKLESILKRRLLSPKTFQASRYELWVAALCITAGFNIDFEDETDNSRGHPEFIATDRLSSIQIAVEAKSRHRHGVQGFNSGLRIAPGDKVDIRRPVTDAYKKQSNLPLYVFVDVNLPPTTDETWQRWIGEIDQTMSDLQVEGYADPCPANIVFFTNDPSHYLMEQDIGADADNLWIKYFIADSPRVPHPPTISSVPDLSTRFMNAYQQRVSPPTDSPEFSSLHRI